MKTKLVKIFIPFLSFSLGFLVLYTFLHWLIILKLDFFRPKEMIVNFITPIIISGIIVLFVFRKKIKLLELSDKTRDFYSVFCGIFLIIPVVIGQFYLVNKQGKLTEIDKPTSIDIKNQTLFYSIKNAKTLNNSGGMWVTRTSSGKHNFNINCFFACPLIDTISNNYSYSNNIKTWIGVKFSEEFSNRIFDNKENQNEIINEFINSCVPKFEKYIFQTKYLRNLKFSDDRDNYYTAIKKTSIQVNKNQLIILVEEKGSYDARTGNSFKWLIGTLLSTNIIWFLFVLVPPLSKTEVRKYGTKKLKKKRKSDYREILFFFTPSKSYWATPIILDLNILVFLLMMFSGLGILSPQGIELIKWGANFKPLTTDGEWWRLLTSIFLHAGFLHLANNMIALFFIGPFLETSIGSKKFMIIYLMTGLIASITSLLYHDAMVSVGASGAIFGMYGLLVALMILRYIDKNLTAILRVSVAIFIGLNLIMGLGGGIDMAAHLGGLISGFVIGIIYFPLKKHLDKINKT